MVKLMKGSSFVGRLVRAVDLTCMCVPIVVPRVRPHACRPFADLGFVKAVLVEAGVLADALAARRSAPTMLLPMS